VKTFYVTFGMGTILRNHYLPVQALSETIVAAWLRNKEQIRFARISESKPAGKPLLDKPEVLHYAAAEHVR